MRASGAGVTWRWPALTPAGCPRAPCAASTSCRRRQQARREQIVADAMRFVGVQYLWGGCSAWGIDCSGFAQLMHRLSGVTLPRDADMQYEAGRPVEFPYQPGDLLFFADPARAAQDLPRRDQPRRLGHHPLVPPHQRRLSGQRTGRAGLAGHLRRRANVRRVVEPWTTKVHDRDHGHAISEVFVSHQGDNHDLSHGKRARCAHADQRPLARLLLGHRLPRPSGAPRAHRRGRRGAAAATA